MKDIFDNWVGPIVMTGFGIIGLMAAIAMVFAVVDTTLDGVLSTKLKEWIKGEKK